MSTPPAASNCSETRLAQLAAPEFIVMGGFDCGRIEEEKRAWEGRVYIVRKMMAFPRPRTDHSDSAIRTYARQAPARLPFKHRVDGIVGYRIWPRPTSKS